ncbi:MAG TPA: glycosyltransferase family 4 protein, partial [Candidatus Dormibacteraeota bacterium]|nr:glycosyltransferase family 4 protein [Candidatus Dormibacteraeota bacterium]
MRVLTFTSLFPNAAEPNLGVFIYQRMAAFAAREGNSVEVIAPIPWAPAWFRGTRRSIFRHVPEVETIGSLLVHHPRYPLLPKVSMPCHAWLMYRGSIALAERLHAERPFDCVDGHYVYPDGKSALLVGEALGIPTVVSARGSDINLFPTFALIRPQIRQTLLHAAGRIAVCEALKAVMRDVAGTSCDIRAIGNGVDPARFFPSDRTEARRQLGLPEGKRVIVCVAALEPVKGHEWLFQALERLTKTLPDVQLHLLGDGPLRSRLVRLARSLGLGGQIHFGGACPNNQLRHWYSAADASCLTSSREGWPNVVLESLACGTPVVATRVWGTPEILNSSDLGVLVEQDVDSIAAGLEQALRRTWDRERLIE